jgi:nucleotide-binding universal stress UspA family protein
MSEGRGVIVVGVDGSTHARRALDWALREARLRDGRCLLIHAYTLGTASAGGVAAAEEIAVTASEVLDHELAFARESGLPVEGRTILGGAAKALLDVARDADADLLVVGSRGRGAFKGALLGSVSTDCVHHATLPVVVIPAPVPVEGAPHG